MALQLLTRADSHAELCNLVDMFLDDLAVRNKTEKTIRYYRQQLEHVLWFARERHWPEDPKAITPAHLRALIRYAQTTQEKRWGSERPNANRPLRDTSVHALARAMRAFFNWLKEQGDLEASPMATIKMPSQESKIIPTFSDQQINSLLACCRRDRRLGLRNEAIILTLLDTGVRASELVQLRLQDVDQGRAKVMGKGRKERYVSLGKRTTRAIRTYVARGRPESESEHVFLGEEGAPLSTDRLTHLVEQLGAKAGISGVRCSPHTFRHTFAITCLRSGEWTIYELLRAMGHSQKSLSVLQRYLSSLGDDDVARAHAKYSPADGMKLKVR